MRSRKLKPHHYYNETYQANIYYCLGWPAAHYCDYLKKIFSHSVELCGNRGRCEFVTYDGGGKIAVIWIKKKDDAVGLAHESLHAANFILSQAGVHPSFDNDEPLAYLMTEIMRKAR